jgi:hypothetical protein
MERISNLNLSVVSTHQLNSALINPPFNFNLTVMLVLINTRDPLLVFLPLINSPNCQRNNSGRLTQIQFFIVSFGVVDLCIHSNRLTCEVNISLLIFQMYVFQRVKIFKLVQTKMLFNELLLWW